MSQTGMIYKLWCKNTLRTYYGSTTGTIANRLTEHEFKFKNGVKHSSADIIEGGNYCIEEMELVDFEDKKELRERERFYIINDKNCILDCLKTAKFSVFFFLEQKSCVQFMA